jgi:hypothetical protein
MAAVLPISATAVSFDGFRRRHRPRQRCSTTAACSRATPGGAFPLLGPSHKDTANESKSWAPVHTSFTPVQHRRRRSHHRRRDVAVGGAADAAATFGDGDGGGEASGVDKAADDGGGDGKLQTLQVFLVELGLISMGIVDTMMVGHVGENALAAASLGGTTTWLVIVTMMGLVGALDPLTSQAFGAGDGNAVKKHLRSGIRASFVLAAGAMITMLGAEPLFHLCGQPAAHAAAAAAYCRVEAWCMLPAVLFQTFRLSLMGTNLFGTLVSAVATANVVNVAMNYILINGVTVAGLVIPAMGLQGAAWATTLSRWFLLAFLMYFSRKPLRWGGASRIQLTHP